MIGSRQLPNWSPLRSSRPAAVALLLALGFAAFYAGVSRGVFVFGDDILMYQVTEAIVERGEVSVTSPARRGDVARSAPGRNGGSYSKYGIGQSLVAIPFYASASWFESFELPETSDRFGNLRHGHQVFATGLTNAATAGAAVALTFLLALEVGFSPLVALAVALCLGIGTLLPHYASTFLSEPLSALCLAVAVLGLLKAAAWIPAKGSRSGHLWLAISGFAAGLAVATKVAHVVIVLPILVWASVLGWSRNRLRGLAGSTLGWSSCLLLWLGVVAIYNRFRFGSMLETGYGSEAGDFSAELAVGLGGLLVSPEKGILWYCPMLLLAVAGGMAFWRRNRVCALVILAASLVWLLLISRFHQWYGGGCWGPRFLVPLLPLWILPVGEILARWRRGSGWKAVVVLVVAFSFITSMTPLLVPFDQVGDPREPATAESMASGWRVRETPLARSLALLPEAISVTTGKLAGKIPYGEVGRPARGPRYPDFAFEHYGSHALLEWSRACFAVAVAALALALGIARRSQQGIREAPDAGRGQELGSGIGRGH